MFSRQLVSSIALLFAVVFAFPSAFVALFLVFPSWSPNTHFANAVAFMDGSNAGLLAILILPLLGAATAYTKGDFVPATTKAILFVLLIPIVLTVVSFLAAPASPAAYKLAPNTETNPYDFEINIQMIRSLLKSFVETSALYIAVLLGLRTLGGPSE